jgi:formylglycine-generating enzyme required for sulfatase activity/outer membrane protein assembly factor BamB
MSSPAHFTSRRVSALLAIGLTFLIAGGAGAQEVTPPRPKPYFDEPAWVHERPPKLTDRNWHAKPAAAGTKPQPLRYVRIVDSGGEIVRRHDDAKTGQGAFSSHLGTTRVSGVDVNDDGKKDDRIQYREFSMDIPFCGRAPVYDIESNSPIFYGGAVTFMVGPKGGGFEEFGINTGEGKNWTFIAPDSATETLMYGVWLWKKKDFRYGGDADRVSFDKTSRIGLHVMRYMWRLDEMRYIVQDGSPSTGSGQAQFYISEYNCGTPEAQALFAGRGDVNDPVGRGLSRHTVGTGGGVVFGMDPTETRWARYEPKAPYDIAFDQEKAKFQKHTFTDVQSVGFYIAKNKWEPRAMAIKWYGFEVLGTVHRKPRPSETLDTALVSGKKDAAGKSIPDFYIAKCEVPYVLFQRVRRWGVSPQFVFDEFYPYVTDNDGDMGSMDYAHEGKLLEHGPDEPATDMTWLDAVLWCNMLSEYEGREPVYYFTSDFKFVMRRALVRRWGIRNPIYKPKVFVKWDADGYRLPTPAEWVAAAGPGAVGDTEAWTGKNAKGTTHDVGTRKPNALGIHDMFGNVWEYTWDAGKQYDPSPVKFKAEHTVMGGDFNFPADPWSKRGNPHGDEPHKGHFSIGLRVVRRQKGLPAPPLALKTPDDVPSWRIKQGQRGKGEKVRVHTDVLAMVESKEGSYVRADTSKIFVSDSFFAKTEVTYAQWKKVRDWAEVNGYVFNYDGDMGSMDYQTWKHRHGPDEPVTGITRSDALIWCNALSQMEGRKPSYYKDAEKTLMLKVSGRIRAHWSRRSKLFDEPELRILGWEPGMNIKDFGYNKGPARTFDTYGLASFKAKYGGGFPPTGFGVDAHVDWSTDGYRLPTLAEWTVACQAGTQTKYYWGDDPDLEGGHVWSWQNSGGKTHPVGLKPSNPLGLHDILGNAFEMCWGSANMKKNLASHENWNPKGSKGMHGIGASHLMQGGSFMESTIGRSSNYAFHTGGGNPKQGGRQSSTIWNWNAFTHLGLRPVRCKARTHRKSGSEMPENIQILDVNLQLPVTPLQGQTHRANLQRTGLFYSKGVRKLPRLKWKFKVKGRIRSCPLALRDKAYIGTDAGIFYALDSETGKEKWRFKMASGPLGDIGKGYHANAYPSAPTIKNGILYMGGAGGFLYALDIKTGRPKWKTTIYGAKTVPGSPLPAYGAVFAPIHGYGRDSGLMAVHGETGQVLTIYRGIDGSKASMSFADGQLLVGQRLINMRSGSGRGGAREGGNYGGNNTTAMYKGRTYAVGGWEGFVSSIRVSDYRSVMKIYSVPIEKTDSRDVRTGSADNTLAVWNDMLYFGTRQGNLYCRDAMTGRPIWKTKLSGPTRNAAVVSTVDNNSEQAVVYIGCDDGNVWALDAITGDRLWSFKTGGMVWVDLWVLEGVIFVASDDGYLYALE